MKGALSGGRVAFELEQGLFSPQPACITGELTTGTQDAVAGHDDTHRVSPHGSTHGPNRLGFVQVPGQMPITHALARRDAQQSLPNQLLEVRACRKIEWQLECVKASCKVSLKLCRGFFQNRVMCRVLPPILVSIGGAVLLVVEPSAAQTFWAGHQGHVSQWAFCSQGVQQFHGLLKNKLKGNGISQPGFVSVTSPFDRHYGRFLKHLPPTIQAHPLSQPVGF